MTTPTDNKRRRQKSPWKYLGIPAILLLLLMFVLTLWEPVTNWLEGEERYDREALREWVREARIKQTLPELVSEYLDLVKKYRKTKKNGKVDPIPVKIQKENKRRELQLHLKTLGDPVTKLYSGQLPLFPVVYRIEVTFDEDLDLPPIIWDSELPRQKRQYQEFPKKLKLDERGAYVQIQYHLRVYASRQILERQEAARRLRLSGLATIVIAFVLLWIYITQNRERERQRQKLLAEQRVNEAERLRLQEELLRQEAERKQEDAERVSLELKSQLWANIGIMAGSYAHNIKNLLVRPNDLLSRCLETRNLPGEQGHMLGEVRRTLGTVTERLQQILQTVRRDPTESEQVRFDLNALISEMQSTWQELAREKWKLTVTLELFPEPLWVVGDHSHLQQAVENLLFNARDATFEMRSHLREKARQMPNNGDKKDNLADSQRRQAIIAAAGWKGEVILRTRAEEDDVVLEVQDNGIGMTEEVRRRCMETHFSTKRNSALFAGMSSGMGLGLSFIQVILDHHGAELVVESEPLKGSVFRIRFPKAQESEVSKNLAEKAPRNEES